MSFSPGKDRNMLAALRRPMQYGWFGNLDEATQFAQPPNLLPGESLLAIKADNSGTIGLLGADANNQLVQSLDVGIAISSAQILTLNTAPLTVIPAPGVGKAIFVSSFVFEMIRTATAYTGAATTELVYAGATGTAISGKLLGTVFSTAGAATTLTAVSGLQTGANGMTLLANTAVQLFTETANYAVGTGTAKIYLTYSIVTL